MEWPAFASLEPKIALRLAQARAAYPGVALMDAEFIDHVNRKLSGGAPLEALHTRDLFLACACARRDVVAIATIEHETFSEIDAAHRRFLRLGITLDDVYQRMREKLFIRVPPAVLSYAGTGPLKAWVRAAALNLLATIAQRELREEPTDVELFEAVLGSVPDTERAYTKLASRAELEAALAAAMRALGDRQKNLLRHVYVDGRNSDEVGAIYAVHRATAARWVAAARAELVKRTFADLMDRLRISKSEARSIIRANLSSIGSILRANLS